MPAPPHFPIKEEGPKSAKLTPKGGLVLAVGLARELALLWITSQARRVGGKKPRRAAGPGRGAGPRWPLHGSPLGARPGASPAAPAPLPPSLLAVPTRLARP